MKALLVAALLAVVGMGAAAVPAPLINDQGQPLLYQRTYIGYNGGALSFKFLVRTNGDQVPQTISYTPEGGVYEDGIAQRQFYFYESLFAQLRSTSFSFILNEDRTEVISGLVYGNLFNGNTIFTLGTDPDIFIRFGDIRTVPSGRFFVEEVIVYAPVPASATALLLGVGALAALCFRRRQVGREV